MLLDKSGIAAGKFAEATHITDDGFTLNWTKASWKDTSKTATLDLSYCICEGSNLEQVQSRDFCLDSKNLVSDCKDSQLKYSVTGRNAETPYFFNVYVKNTRGVVAIYEGIEQKTASNQTSLDSIAPTPGSFSAASNISTTGLQLNWTSATDAGSLASDLEYFVCQATDASLIDSIDECLAATQAQGFTPATTSLQLSGLTPNKNYFFNIVVEDKAGNRGIYTVASVSTSAIGSAPSLTINEPSGANDVVAINGTFSNITFTASDADDNATISLYYSTAQTNCTSGTLTGWTQIVTGLAENTVATYAWNTTGLSAGNYYVCGKIDDGKNATVYSQSASFLKVNAIPTISVTSPASAVAITTAQGYTITFAANDSDDNATIALYYKSSTNNCDSSLTGWTSIVTGLSENTATNHLWNTSSGVSLGSYYICARISDSVNSAVFAVSSATIAIGNLPTVSSVTTTHADGAFTVGEVFDLKIIYSESVTVAGGTPTLKLETGSTDRSASYLSGSGSTDLIFRYTVQSGDETADLDVHSSTPQITLNGATIKSTSSTLNADLNVPKASDSGSLAGSAAISIDTVAPTLTLSTITIGADDITNLTLRPHWTAASDNITSTANLEYKLVYSTSDNISSISNAETNGTTAMNYTANTLVAVASSLTANTAYYLNVIVKDQAGNKTIYTRKTQTTESMCGGDGTIGTPYQICTLGDLQSMRDYLSSYFILNNDIDASSTATWNNGAGWDPVGNDNPGTDQFTGGFNGNFKVIRGLTISRQSETYVGLFGYVGYWSGTISNVGLQDITMAAGTNSGALAGYVAGDSTKLLQYNYSTGSIAVGSGRKGGLFGTVDGAIVDSSFSTVNGAIGGLLGSLGGSSTVQNSYATGDFTLPAVSSTVAGGLVSNMFATTLVKNSFATGNYIGPVSNFVGGLVGGFANVGPHTITASFASGNGVGDQFVGGLIGNALNAGTHTISHSIAMGHVSANWYSGGFIGGGVATDISYSLATGRNASTVGDRAAFSNLADTTNTKNFAYDRGDGKTCLTSSSDSNCAFVTTGSIKPFAFRFAPELEYVEKEYLLTTSVGMRKISSSDKSAYKIWGSCTIQGATINISATDSVTTLNSTTSCISFAWNATLNLSTLVDGAVTITADQAGSNTKNLHLTKDTSYCDGNPSNGDFAAGNGTVGTPYLICTTAQFDKIRNYLAADTYFKLRNNLDLKSGFSGPIGNNSAGNCTSRFCGIVQGNGHVVRNAFLIYPTTDFVGIFGYMSSTNARIEKLGFENINVVGGNTIGTVLGYAIEVALEHVYVQGSIIATPSASTGDIGGLVGVIGNKALVTDSYANVNIIANRSNSGSIGGFIGSVGGLWAGGPSFVITNSEANGSITHSGNGAVMIGGFVGGNYEGSGMSKLVARGHIISTGSLCSIGGFSGNQQSVMESAVATGSLVGSLCTGYGTFAGVIQSNGATVSKSLATGHIISSRAWATDVGGFAGALQAYTSVQIQNSVAVGTIYSASSSTSGGIVGQISNQTGTKVANSYYWSHALAPSACIGTDLNAGDSDTCNDVESAAFYQTFSNFTSATSVYSGWDFSNTWKFPSGGGLPILKWIYEP